MRASDRLRVGVVAAIVVSSVALAGCSAAGDPVPTATPTGIDLDRVDVTDVERNGIEYLTGEQVVSAVVDAVGDAGPVSLAGTFQERAGDDGGSTRRLEIALVGTDSRFTADVRADGIAMTAVVVDGRAYVSGNAPFADVLGVPEASGGVVCLAADDPRVDTFAPALSVTALLESLLDAESGVTVDAADDPSSVEDSAEFVVGSGGSPIGSLVVATTGPAVPLSLVLADARGDASFTFEWNGDAPAVEAPSDVAVPCG